METAARTAVLGLSDHLDLGQLWEVYERQISDRLRSGAEAAWARGDLNESGHLEALARGISLIGERADIRTDPLQSELSMGAVFAAVEDDYSKARSLMSADSRAHFDESFQQWLYAVYDPLAALAAYFGNRKSESTPQDEARNRCPCRRGCCSG